MPVRFARFHAEDLEGSVRVDIGRCRSRRYGKCAPGIPIPDPASELKDIGEARIARTVAANDGAGEPDFICAVSVDIERLWRV